jgi:hypothetical protein
VRQQSGSGGFNLDGAVDHIGADGGAVWQGRRHVGIHGGAGNQAGSLHQNSAFQQWYFLRASAFTRGRTLGRAVFSVLKLCYSANSFYLEQKAHDATLDSCPARAYRCQPDRLQA